MIVQRPMRRFLLAALPALVAIMAVVVVPIFPASPSEARVGGRVPNIQLPAVPGGPSRGQFRIREHLNDHDVIAILFWATWCQPCRHELPFYNTLYEELRGQGFAVVAISMDGSNTVAQAGPMARRLGLTYPVVSDLDTAVTNQINPRRSAPYSIWVNRAGRIAREKEGFALSERGEIREGITALVAEARPGD